ncbi:menaquinone biosynthesis decarboxylase [Helicobacter sp. 13S00401-1]|uniref:menaquinone biosynthesis decarboxylase n=1 Tax=Helicobacter sp. 13S00401-1 TaxID=1905758 RepID=UPI000BA7C3B7|nr:menaquinone biosynthesis decarboxylase [Helicobacter sp. 13S00401-1]PAF51669.1 menaquinone biosynthesis decarboxylase [Helicobacter sp. 13S00401-1]
MQELINLLVSKDLLKVIDTPLDVDLEIAHLAYIEVKKQDSKALLFTSPMREGKKLMPVLMNVFGSFSLLDLIASKDSEAIASHIKSLLNMSPPKTLKEKLSKLKEFYALRHAFPKKYKGKAPAQEVVLKDIDLFLLPVLKTWEEDAGYFITMGQVYTRSLDGKANNLGLYRLQVKSKDELLMHFQIHKDASHFYHEYKKANKNMPVSVAIGGDPLYTWCAQAPLPPRIFELFLYGLIKEKNPLLVKCLTNELSVPHDSDIVIEGEIDINTLADEGEFGDHTGFYTPVEKYPVLKVAAITHKKNPTFLATVVGKPPLEDKYMGYMTERVFLPLLQTTTHGLLDYHMPENGVFHNLILAKLDVSYPAQALQAMHAFFGIGQLSFVKHAIFLDSKAPSLQGDFENLTKYILERVDASKLLITKGICDILDHASSEYGVSGKLGVDATGEALNFKFEDIDDISLLEELKKELPELNSLHIFKAKNPVVLISIDKKDRRVKSFILALEAFKKYASIFIFVDSANNDLKNYYMLIWRIVNNIDVLRDLYIKEGLIVLDATAKGDLEGYTKKWPKEVFCNKAVIKSLVDKGLIKEDSSFFDRFGILNTSHKGDA